MAKQFNVEVEGSCVCLNCRQLSQTLQECAICRNNLKTVGIWTCSDCCNMTCWLCALRLPLCPFCRSLKQESATRSTALERILAKIELPCPLPRLLENKVQSIDTVSCPSLKTCNWRGELYHLKEHLEKGHAVSLLEGVSITIEIAKFRSKVDRSDNRGQIYMVALKCYNSVFSCNVSLHNRRLRLSFCGVSHREGRFGVWLEVSTWFRTMTGILPLTVRHCGRHKELNISSEGLLSPWKNNQQDSLNITLTIRSLD